MPSVKVINPLQEKFKSGVPRHVAGDKTFQLVPISPNPLQPDHQPLHDLFYQPYVNQPKSENIIFTQITH